MTAPLQLQPIQPQHDAPLAIIIRSVLEEFGAVGEGFAHADPEVDAMHRAYTQPRHRYYTVMERERVLGGGGYGPLLGGDSTTCELRKLYFSQQARGRGAGRALLTQLMEQSREDGFTSMYIESLDHMESAVGLYLAHGFKRIDKPMGNTGHYNCQNYFVRDLTLPRETL